MFSSNTSAVSADAVFVEEVFQTHLYQGTGSTQTITNGIDLAGKGGLTWIKARNTASATHILQDTARGISKYLYSSLTNAENSVTGYGITTFGSTGFTLVDDSNGSYGVNGSSGGTSAGNGTYASWTFRKQPKFFDVVTWTGNGANPRQIAHNLGSVPGCIIVKSTTRAENWTVYHRSLGNAARMALNTTDAQVTGTGVWGSTTPTSTHFTVSADNLVNFNGDGYVAYLFAHDAGGFGLTGTDNVISCGSFTATGSAQTINLGYEPQWVLFKRSSEGGGGWFMEDIMRGMPVSGDARVLFANTSQAEGAASVSIRPTSTGFSIDGGILNTGDTFIYIAIRRGPMKTPTTGTSVFYPQTVAQTDTPDSTGVPFPPDLVNTFSRNGTDRASTYDNFLFVDRLRSLGTPSNTYSSATSGRGLISSSTGAEVSGSAVYVQLKADSQNITRGGGWNDPAYGNWIYYFMRRAPGFFDVVCYTGTGGFQTVSHNLGVAPELVIFKGRGSPATNWITLVSSLSKFGYLNNTLAVDNDPVTYFTTNGSTYAAPTATSLFLNNLNVSNYVAYLFASCPGVSKVGSYTGTGAAQTINCGFTGGARWVMIKRTDSTGSWFVWDTARGMVAGTDPYLQLNSTDAEVYISDLVLTTAGGFQITSSAGAALNANGGTYIFLAIA